tara:strand:- start:155 stop:511 length:357 start_codon:yes stop_codon:yes gene_type:complete
MKPSSLSEFLGPETISQLRDPDLNLAKGLPASIYTDPDFFTFEKERLFPNVWVGIGFESDVPNVGDAVPVEVDGSTGKISRSATKALLTYLRVGVFWIMRQRKQKLTLFKVVQHLHLS